MRKVAHMVDAEQWATVSRRVDRVHATTPMGSDPQVDNKAAVLPPGNFELFDPFLLMFEDWFSAPGFDWHPHRGLETVTFVLDGVLEHGDNQGHAGILEPGSAQWMTAGSGIVHREHAHRNEFAHTLQLWLNLPASHKMVEPRYQDITLGTAGIVETPGTRVTLISGRLGDTAGPALTHWPVTGLHISAQPGKSVSVPLPAVDRAFFYVKAGTAVAGANETRIDANQVGWSDPSLGASTALEVSSVGEVPLSVVLFSGPPIGESVVARGPFVMNTADEIECAFRDFRSGQFGEIPAMARL